MVLTKDIDYWMPVDQHIGGVKLMNTFILFSFYAGD